MRVKKLMDAAKAKIAYRLYVGCYMKLLHVKRNSIIVQRSGKIAALKF